MGTLELHKYYRDRQFAVHENSQTLAASATMSGSSIAVTSFKAGREFATSTTCTHPLYIQSYQC